MVPAFLALIAMRWFGVPFVAALVLAILASMLLLGVAFRYVIVGPLIRRGVLPLVISTIALSILLKESVKDFYSAEAQTFPTLLPDTLITVAGVSVSLAQTRRAGRGPGHHRPAAMVPGRHPHRPADAGDGAEPDRGPHPGRAGRAHDPLHLPDQCRARRHGLAAGLADLPRQVLQRRDARPGRLRGGHRRRLQPGARRHRRRPADRRPGQPRRRLCLDGLPAGHSPDPAGPGHPVPPAGPAGPREERAV